MSAFLDENNLLQTLLAFVDGELDVAQTAAVLDYLVDHPQWLAVMRDQQRLRLHAHQVLHTNTPAIGESFRKRIEELGQDVDNSHPAQPLRVTPSAAEPIPDLLRPQRQALRWPAIAAAAAIALIFGLIAGHAFLPRSKLERAITESNPPAVSPELVSAVTRVHVDCSRFNLPFHAGPFPTGTQSDLLAEDVRRAFHSSESHPDLTTIGYKFIGAGPCAQPLQDTVHLLYRATSPVLRETLSVFVQPFHGQIDIPVGQMRIAASADSPHPAYVWRTATVVYFIVADDPTTANQGRDAILLAMAK